MDKFELLSDLADGLLDSTQEQELYAELAINEELRVEFKQLLTLNSTIKNNSSLFAVSNSSTNAIFGAIGIPAASTPIVEIGKTGLFTGFKFAKYSQAFMSSGVATLTTAALFLLFFNFYGEEYFSGELENKFNQITKFDSEKNANVSYNDANTYEEKTNEIKLKKFVEPIARVKSSNNQKQNNINPSANELKTNKNFGISTNSLTLNKDSNFIEKNDANFENKKSDLTIIIENKEQKTNEINFANIIDNNVITHNKNKDRYNIAFEVRGFQNWHTEKETISPAEIADFNNTGISAIFNLDDNFSVGFELRQETFFQKFSGLDKIGQFNLYEQQPNFTTYGMVIRYGVHLTESIKPIAQITLGGTNVGFIGRAMSGIQYIFSDELRFIIGLEYSNLFYDYQSQNFNSDKIGFNYGISYNF